VKVHVRDIATKALNAHIFAVASLGNVKSSEVARKLIGARTTQIHIKNVQDIHLRRVPCQHRAPLYLRFSQLLPQPDYQHQAQRAFQQIHQVKFQVSRHQVKFQQSFHKLRLQLDQVKFQRYLHTLHLQWNQVLHRQYSAGFLK